MRRMRTTAITAAASAMQIATPEMRTTRGPTETLSWGACTEASADPMLGATGSASVVDASSMGCARESLSGTSPPFTGGRARARAGGHRLLEEERRVRAPDARGGDPLLERGGEHAQPRGGKLAHAGDELRLHRDRSAPQHGAAAPGKPDLDAPGVRRRGLARDEPAVEEPAHHDGDRALVGEGARGELVHGARRGLLELLEHEELRAGEADAPLDGMRVEAKRPHHGAQGIERAGAVFAPHRRALRPRRMPPHADRIVRIVWSPMGTRYFSARSREEQAGPGGACLRAYT